MLVVLLSIVTLQAQICSSIYVDGVNGNDANTGDASSPLKTLTAAVPLLTSSRNYIKITTGNYSYGSVLNIPAGAIIEGGYSNAGGVWTKLSNAPSSISFTGSESISGVCHRVGIKSNGTNNWKLIDLNISTTAATGVDGSNRGCSNYGVLVIGNSTGYEIIRCVVAAGSGSAGIAGIAGGANNGGVGATSGGAGGSGNNGCDRTGGSGTAGNAGTAGGTTPAGAGGAGGAGTGAGGSGGRSDGCNIFGCNSEAQNDAGAGGVGSNGGNGAGFAANVRPVATLTGSPYFIPVNGALGAGGGGGQKGGGGGGQAYGTCCACSCPSDRNAAIGGNGGNGGNGGAGGSGGTGGGGSFGLYVGGTSGIGNVFSSQFNSNSGGVGGSGGAGVGGSTGANGSAGGNTGGCSAAQGASGGKGGNGGAGGRGQDGAIGLSQPIAFSGGATIIGNSVSVPASPVVSIQNVPKRYCQNSVINLSTSTGSWTLPSNLQFVRYNNTSAPSEYNVSAASIDVFSTVASASYNLAVGGNTYNSYINVSSNRTLPTITILQSNLSPLPQINTVCKGTDIALQANSWGTELEYKWEIFQSVNAPNKGLTTNLVYSSTSQSPVTNIGFPNVGTYTVRYQVRENCCGWSIPVFINFDVIETPVIAYVSGSTNFCNGGSSNIAVTNVPGATYSWTLSGDLTGASTTDVLTVTTGPLGGNIQVTATNACGTSNVETIAITPAGVPATPSAITGNIAICQTSSSTFSVVNDPSITAYNWTLPSGWSGTSTTNSISVTPSSAGGTIAVTATSACGTSSASALFVNVDASIPAQPVLASTPVSMCAGNTQTVSVNNVSGVDYVWTLSGDLTGTSTTNSIVATAGPIGGTLTVEAINSCGASTALVIPITSNDIPLVSSATLTGNLTACVGNSETYTVNNVTGATNYTWTLPSGWSGTSNSNSIIVTPGANSGTIAVVADNSCGVAAPVQISVTSNDIPVTPSFIVGNTVLCSSAQETYNVTNDPLATSYTWTLPLGWGGTSTSNSITTTPGVSGVISVVANNSCGTSPASTLTINTGMPITTQKFVTACNEYTLNGQIYSQSGVYTQQFVAQNGCDSVVSLNLTIVSTGSNAISINGGKMTASITGATYQWVSCPGYLPIVGQNNRDFYPTVNGSYAVIVSSGGCIDTSACVQMTSVSIQEENPTLQTSIFPNPSDLSTNLVIYSGVASEQVQMYIIDMTGRIISQQQLSIIAGKQVVEINTSNLSGGLYQIQLVDKNRVASTLKLVVSH